MDKIQTFLKKFEVWFTPENLNSLKQLKLDNITKFFSKVQWDVPYAYKVKSLDDLDKIPTDFLSIFPLLVYMTILFIILFSVCCCGGSKPKTNLPKKDKTKKPTELSTTPPLTTPPIINQSSTTNEPEYSPSKKTDKTVKQETDDVDSPTDTTPTDSNKSTPRKSTEGSTSRKKKRRDE